MELPNNIDDILIYYKLGYDIEHTYLRDIVNLINTYIPEELEDETSYFNLNDKKLMYSFNNQLLCINTNSSYFRECEYYQFGIDDINKVYNKLHGTDYYILFSSTLIEYYPTEKYLDIKRPNIISISHDGLKHINNDTVVFYDKINDIKYNVEYREFSNNLIIGDIIEHENIKVVDISSLIYFRKFTRVEQYDLFSMYHHNIVIICNGTIEYLCYGNDSRYNNIGEILNANPSLREYYNADKLLIHLLTDYDISKKDIPLEIIPNETRKQFIIDGKSYYAYSEEEAIVSHESRR